jgi:hypothetical protein
MASDPGPPPLTTHEDPEGRHPASDPAVQAESPGPEPAHHPDIPAPDGTTHPDSGSGRAVAGAVLIAFLATILTVGTMAAFSAADRTLWWGALVAAGAGIVVGAAWGAAGRRYPV